MSLSTEKARPSFWRGLNPGDHVCHVYKDEAGLLDTLCGFVGGALWAGESAIVLATDGHLLQLEELLRQSGLDLAHFRATDAYIPLSADASLGRFMDAGWPDAERFESFLGPVLLRARRGGREVRAFGELVALLWSRGEHAATVRLEHLWNRLLEREKIRLLCGYSKSEFARGSRPHARQIGEAHTLVVRE
jgi:hypothetical protein